MSGRSASIPVENCPRKGSFWDDPRKCDPRSQHLFRSGRSWLRRGLLRFESNPQHKCDCEYDCGDGDRNAVVLEQVEKQTRVVLSLERSILQVPHKNLGVGHGLGLVVDKLDRDRLDRDDSRGDDRRVAGDDAEHGDFRQPR